MLEWALLSYAVALAAPAFGQVDVAMSAAKISVVLLTAWLGLGMLAAIFHRPLERRALRETASAHI